jgi:predicted nucleic acid-binding protein
VDAVTGELFDTDVFVDHLRGAHRLAPAGGRVAYSSITRCELFAGRHVDEAVVCTLLEPFEEVPVDREIAERAGVLRRTLPIRPPDALIAATALLHGLALVTRNVRDFEKVPKLRVRRPRD